MATADPPFSDPHQRQPPNLDSVAQAEAHLARLERERQQTLARLQKLRTRESAASATAGPTSSEPSSLDAAEKVALFRRLFRGREDIYPRLWVNERTGKKGYAPACANEWMRGICEKPKVRCGECPNQAFIPVTDDVVLGHLRGRHVIGVYPLLPDETCWLLAADFDEQSWQEDLRAFAETSRAFGVPVTIERSRSGNGGHAWFFFAEPVSAGLARRMGCYLLTETMSRRHELSLKSYDRLFPSQDTMPRGGFGNLIALPLQFEARKRGNTLFLDEDLVPIADPWAHLLAIAPITRARVEKLAEKAAREGRVLGLPLPGAESDEDTAPWARAPSRPRRTLKLSGPLPAQVRGVSAQRIFVEKAGLPSPLITEIKRLAAFQNPQFYERQGMRLSTALVPRVISCAEESVLHVGLPRGCEVGLRDLLTLHGIALELRDERIDGNELRVSFDGRLTDVQEQAVAALRPHEIGVFVAPPGVGKTVVGVRMIAERARSALVLVHRKPLVDQWRSQLALFLGIPVKDVGRIGSGASKANGRLDVAMMQSLVRKGEVSDVVAGYGHVVVDECHHVSAVSFERILSETKARYVLGLTATPRRRDGQDLIVVMQCGPIRFRVGDRDPAAQFAFSRRLVVRDTGFRLPLDRPEPTIQDVYGLLVRDDARNRMIVADVRQALAEGRSPLVLTERREHLDVLAAGLRDTGVEVVALHGGLTTPARRAALELLTRPDAVRVIIATGRFAGEGFDDPRLDTLFLALPVSWRGTLVQYAGRLHRRHAAKTEVRVYDYVDRSVAVLGRMFERRLRGYRAIGYSADSPAEGATGQLLSV